MAKFRITAPDGGTYEITAPEGATEQDVMAFVQQQMGGNDFASRAASMDPTSLSVARAKNDEFGEYLRNQAMQPRQGESEDQRFQRLYGGLSQEKRPGYLEGIARSVVQGGMFGGGDEFVAAGAAALDPLFNGSGNVPYGERYNTFLSRERGRLGQFREDAPVTAIASEVAGAIPTAALPVLRGAQAAQGASPGARALAGGLTGALQGGLYGFNAGEGGFTPRAENAAVSGAIGGGIGAAAPVVGSALKKTGKRLAETRTAQEFMKDVPDTEALRNMGSQLFKKAEDAGVVVKSDAMRNQVDDIARWASKEGIDPTLHPGATAALKRLTDAADEPLGLDKIQTLRRVLGSAAQSTSADEHRIASGMIDKLDDFVAKLAPDQIEAGNLGTAADDLVNARDIWSRMKKSELIDEAFTKAANQASGTENGLRIQFRQILNNKRLRRSFSPEEIAAMERVVQGDFATNTLRRIGRLSAGSGQQHNTMMATLGMGAGAGAGSVIGGPAGAGIGAIAVPALGYGAQKGAEALTARNARLAQALMASGAGGNIPYNPEMGRLVEMLIRQSAPIAAPVRENVR